MIDALVNNLAFVLLGFFLGWLTCRRNYRRDWERLAQWSDALHARQRQVEKAEDVARMAADDLRPYAKPSNR